MGYTTVPWDGPKARKKRNNMETKAAPAPADQMEKGSKWEEENTEKLLSICGPIEPTLRKLILASVRAAYSQGFIDGKYGGSNAD